MSSRTSLRSPAPLSSAVRAIARRAVRVDLSGTGPRAGRAAPARDGPPTRGRRAGAADRPEEQTVRSPAPVYGVSTDAAGIRALLEQATPECSPEWRA